MRRQCYANQAFENVSRLYNSKLKWKKMLCVGGSHNTTPVVVINIITIIIIIIEILDPLKRDKFRH